MFGTVEDAGSVYGLSTLFAEFVKNKVPVEAHFFQNGVHGSGFAIGDPILGEVGGTCCSLSAEMAVGKAMAP